MDDMISRAAAIKPLPSAQLVQDLPNGCTDTISRQAAIETVRKAQSIGQAHRMLLQLPSAQPGWIPCSERLPKPNEYENDVRVYYLVQNEYGDMMVCSWHGGFWLQMYRNTHVEDQVVAWMPLPAPYRREGGQDGTD